jgi:hypothetical protein
MRLECVFDPRALYPALSLHLQQMGHDNGEELERIEKERETPNPGRAWPLLLFFFFFLSLHFAFHSTEKYKGNYAAKAVYRNNCTRSKTRVQSLSKRVNKRVLTGPTVGSEVCTSIRPLPQRAGAYGVTEKRAKRAARQRRPMKPFYTKSPSSKKHAMHRPGDVLGRRGLGEPFAARGAPCPSHRIHPPSSSSSAGGGGRSDLEKAGRRRAMALRPAVVPRRPS